MSTSLVATEKGGFYQNLILGTFMKMPYGSLSMALPSGQTFLFGDGKGIKAEIYVKDPDFFRRCVLFGDIGFGEAYVEGLWETPDVSNVIKWFIQNIEFTPGASGSKVKDFALNILKFWNRISHWRKANSVEGSRENISKHYDLNNDFFSLFLDPTMTYSCAYFSKDGESLREAQVRKYDRLCQEMKLLPGMSVLEIGSGWGGNAIHMAKTYDVNVTSITISKEQKRMADERIAEAGLEGKIKIELKDYRELSGKFDRIVSIEMLEAVGDAYIDVYFKKCHELLKKDGMLAIQTITCHDSRYEELKNGVDWIQKHIFPGSLLPSIARINKAINNTGNLTMVDLKEMGHHYAQTLKCWQEAFNASLDEVKKLGFDDAFVRKWNYYLSYCEAAFTMRNINVMQLVFSRPNSN